MYVGAGGIKDLLDWFNSANRFSEKMLCLFVPGGPEDNELLGRLFDARGGISSHLGDDIALVLFSSRATLSAVRARDPDRADLLFVPGLVETRNLTNHWRPTENWKRVDLLRAESVPATVREEVLRRSHYVGVEIARYFDIELSDLPCLIFVAPGEDLPFTVRTRGAADVNELLALFSDLRRITMGLSAYGMLRIPQSIADRSRLDRQRDELAKELDELDRAASLALGSAAAATTQYGLSAAILAVGSRRAHHLFRYLGLPHKDKRPISVPAEVVEGAKAALLDQAAHVALRTATNAGLKRRKTEIKLEEVDEEIKRLDYKLSLATIKSRLRTVEDMIDETCAKYESRFRRARNYMTLRKFTRIFTGTAKAIESVTTSLGSTADAVVGTFEFDAK